MIVAAVIAVVVLAVGAFIITQGNKSGDSMMKDDAMMEQSEDTMMKDDKASGEDAMMKDDTAGDAMMEDKSSDSMMKEDTMMKDDKQSYLPYSSTVLADTAGRRRVLFFYANWCPTCRPADADFQANASKFPADVSLIRVNYNDTETDQEEKNLAQKYGVTYQHTYVEIDAQGNKVQTWNGGQTAELLAHLK